MPDKKPQNQSAKSASKSSGSKTSTKVKKTRVDEPKKIVKNESSKDEKATFILLRPLFAVGRFFRHLYRKMADRIRDLQSRRPHRSLYLTQQGDAKRRTDIPGYFAFSNQVWKLLWRNRWLFAKFLILYSLLSVVIVGLMSQESFASIRDALEESSITGLDKWSTLLSSALSGSGSSSDATKQVLAVVLFLFGWLTLVWLLRRLASGDQNKLKLRDGLYSSGSSVLALSILVVIILVQLLPLAIVLLAYASVTSVGWINNGIAIENMAALCALAVVAVLTLYWVCGSFIALIIVTLPGMYPMQAIRAAGDLIVGRRLKLLLRLLFMALPIIVVWLAILVPAILIDSWLKLSWQPLVPIVVMILSTVTLIWCSSYIYMLYRQFVDSPGPPVLRKGKSSKPPKAKKKLFGFKSFWPKKKSH